MKKREGVNRRMRSFSHSPPCGYAKPRVTLMEGKDQSHTFSWCPLKVVQYPDDQDLDETKCDGNFYFSVATKDNKHIVV
jgi:hypothetical protein